MSAPSSDQASDQAPCFRELIHYPDYDQQYDRLYAAPGAIGSRVNAFEALPLSGSVMIPGSFAEEQVKANSAYRALF
ncbi:hypothetical protein QF035_005865 [Streptomyces umbrinus]|uniref:Uncharacterized protein n=1 Tax=Streptomyces umbrinus TaxID=67370 RepID=A0ABU0SXX0_9ACTN|nr:hypothetical protein [Streptomyces umbrinus]MDQ1028283.1 hypothetical protein [Streptomyces umbrinus]